MHTYKIGQTICLQIDPTDPTRNIPSGLARLRCADVGSNEDLNIPSPIPPGRVTWTHVSEDGRLEADFAVNLDPSDISTADPPPEFEMLFPLLVRPASLDIFSAATVTETGSTILDFSTNNVTRNISTPQYQVLMQAFGLWTCTFNNSLGSDTASTFITDNCT